VLGDVVISQRAFDGQFPRPKNVFTFVNVAGGPSLQTQAALDRAIAPYSDAKVATKANWMTKRSNGINKILKVFYVLLALSVIISLFGIVNALVLSVFERTREIGMMRAVGMTCMQGRRMVRHESVITALIGGCLRLPSASCSPQWSHGPSMGADIAFSLPLGSLVVLALVAIAAGILAAVLPARRASRLNVLRALEYE
jgi:putative ABC transport system permease protein